ncbi:MAG: AMP-dependent synthetase [Actinobacteria bacterium]|nr:AMP-dependent synthetase [Actinomycetota bacterium]
MNELVCLDLPLGGAFVDRLRRAWDDGDAVFPLDQRLPAPARALLTEAVAPTMVHDGTDDVRVGGTPVEPGDAVVVATSGSSGSPKGVVLTHDAVSASARAVHTRLNVTSADTWLACLPPAHIGGLSVVMRSIVTGTPCISVDGFSPESYDSAAAHGATLVSLVATALQRVDPGRYRTIVLGGARPPADRPPNCVATYGMTETGSGIVYDGIPLDGVELEVRDGIIHVRGPMLMRGYRNAPSTIDADGWLRTGDIGSIGADGRVSVEGREGDLIITGGENVWPEAVEASLMSHAAITDCCVVGRPDPEWGQSVHAFIVSTEDMSLAEVREHCKLTLPSHAAPKHVHRVDAIPRTALGKPRRGDLANPAE